MDFSPQVILRLMALAAVVLAVVFAALAAITYRKDDIAAVRRDLSGKARQASAAELAASRRPAAGREKMRALERRRLNQTSPSASAATSGSASSSAASRKRSAEPSAEGTTGSMASGESRDTSRSVSRHAASTAGRSTAASVTASSAIDAASRFVVVKSLVLTDAEEVVEIK